jgi:L-asparaginase
MTGRTLLVLYAGGTIGMVEGRVGLVPSRRFAKDIERWIGRGDTLTRVTVEAVEPLIDSANAEPATWYVIARRIWVERNRVDGVIVLHGTDTLAYTASALSFLLADFAKPIILTGAQAPFAVPGSDGEANVGGALACALDPRVCEVGVFFDRRLLRGNRARKWSTRSGEGFFSPHWPELARLGRKLRLSPSALLRVDAAAKVAKPARPGRVRAVSVGLLKLYPGISDRMIAAAADAHPHGLVLELYGAGSGPAKSRAIRTALAAVAARGIPVVGVSQCVRGRVTQDAYAASRVFAECGVVSGCDLTPEAALTKLVYLRNAGVSADLIAAEIGRPVAGELTPDLARPDVPDPTWPT